MVGNRAASSPSGSPTAVEGAKGATLYSPHPWPPPPSIGITHSPPFCCPVSLNTHTWTSTLPPVWEEPHLGWAVAQPFPLILSALQLSETLHSANSGLGSLKSSFQFHLCLQRWKGTASRIACSSRLHLLRTDQIQNHRMV